jgi:hypothetical protein
MTGALGTCNRTVRQTSPNVAGMGREMTGGPQGIPPSGQDYRPIASNRPVYPERSVALATCAPAMSNTITAPVDGLSHTR